MNSARCPICQKPIESQPTGQDSDLPFCSERCRLIDLGRWLGEVYRVPADSAKAPAGFDDEEDSR
jgi:endogenous inhibitor of DNA gyrase (YacG/DUF329 family)